MSTHAPAVERSHRTAEVGPLDRIAVVADQLHRNGLAADGDNRFPAESVPLLIEAGVARAPLPTGLGGLDLDPNTLVKLVVAVSAADPGLGLVTAMHVVHSRRLFADAPPSSALSAVAADIVAGRGFLSSLVSENRSIAPARGGTVSGRAVPVDGGWLLSTHKRYATGIHALAHAIVAAHIDGEAELRHFLVPIRPETSRIDSAWDVLGLRTSGSDDVVFENVFVPSELLLPAELFAQNTTWWSLVLSSVYAGIAEGAAGLVTSEGLPAQAGGLPPVEVPRIRHYLGEASVSLLTVRALLDTAISRHIRGELTAADAAGTKLAVHRNATVVLDQVGRAFGTASVWQTHAWQRYFRDLRVGAHNSPSEDTTADELARQFLGS